MPNENDLEGKQDQGGKHGGQAGMPKPQLPSPDRKPERRDPPHGKVVGDPRSSMKRRPRRAHQGPLGMCWAWPSTEGFDTGAN
jgi:hypothetical protein